jgi:hypothetical protein
VASSGTRRNKHKNESAYPHSAWPVTLYVLWFWNQNFLANQVPTIKDLAISFRLEKLSKFLQNIRTFERSYHCPINKFKLRPGNMVHAYNSSCSGDRDPEDWGSRPTLAKKLARTHFTNKKQGVVVHTCHPSYTKGSTNRRIMTQAQLGKSEIL